MLLYNIAFVYVLYIAYSIAVEDVIGTGRMALWSQSSNQLHNVTELENQLNAENYPMGMQSFRRTSHEQADIF